MLRSIRYQIAKSRLRFQWFLLGGYYVRLGVQARYLYRQSDLFKYRWQEVGLNYAEQSFDSDLNNIGKHFFQKAKNSPWIIKRRIILDWFLRKPPRPYTIIVN